MDYLHYSTRYSFLIVIIILVIYIYTYLEKYIPKYVYPQSVQALTGLPAVNVMCHGIVLIIVIIFIKGGNSFLTFKNLIEMKSRVQKRIFATVK